MNTHAEKTQENKGQSVASSVFQKQSGGESIFQFVDNRPEAIAQQKLQEMATISPQAKQAAQLQAMANNYSAQQQQPIQKKENNTGLPDNLKTGMENMSGMLLDDVKVHRYSEKPAQLQAHAYAQGTDIHIGPGQEKHLPHEAWHVVQQKQGRVKPTAQIKGKLNINDDTGLEKEADVMGAKALQMKHSNEDKVNSTLQHRNITTSSSTLQRKVGFELEVPLWSITKPNGPYAKNIKLATGTGWYLQSDLLGGASVDPEFVVMPVDETPAGLASLTAAMANLTAFGAGLVGAAAGPIPMRGLAGVTGQGMAGIIDRRVGPLLADPQVTAGIHKDRVLDLLTDLGNIVIGPGGGQIPGSAGTAELAEGPGAALSLETASQAGQALIAAPNNRSREYAGLVALVGHQVYRGRTVMAQYSKQLASVMVRSKIPPALVATDEIRNGTVTIVQWRADVLNAATDAGADVVPALADPLIFAWGVGVGPTVQAYLDGLYGGQQDLLANTEPSMGAMGTERVGPVQTYFGFDVRPKGLIVELRDIKQDIPMAQWTPFAIAIFNYVQGMNDLAVAAPVYAGIPGFGLAAPPPVPAAALPPPPDVGFVQGWATYLRAYI